MPKRKAAQTCKFLPWLTAKKVDKDEGRFLQISNSFMLSEVFQKNLSSGAKIMYLCMAMEAGGKRDFKFPNTAIKKYSLPVRTARRWITELETEGFIKCDHALYSRQANTYSFCSDWKDRPPKT